MFRLFGYVEKGLDKKAMTSQTGQQAITIHMVPNISKSKDTQAMQFSQLIKYSGRNIFFKINNQFMLVPDFFLIFNPFVVDAPFLYPVNIRKPYGFLIFSEGRARVHLERMS